MLKTFATSLLVLNFLMATGQQNKALSTREMSRLLPDRIKGYALQGETKTTQMKIGTLTYTLSEKNFGSGNRSVRILLFDYGEAPIMYQQAMRKRREIGIVETDSLIYRLMDPADSSSWESYSSASKHSQIVKGINNRFFLTMDGDKMELYELKQILMNLDFGKFPKVQ